MLPEKWAEPHLPPENLSLPGEWPTLKKRYATLAGESDVLPAVYGLANGLGATQASIEFDYIDADYRDEFSHFYATTFRALPDRCERIHFLKGHEYLGFSVIRPIIERPVSRTLMPPPGKLADSIGPLCESKVHPYGFPYDVSGFPFLSQDFQYGVCAHAAIWMIAMYYHLSRSHGRYFISDVVEAAQQHALGRAVPSAGLNQLQIATALRQLKLPPLQYVPESLERLNQTFERLACRYLNSRIPVLLLIPRHTLVLIGYGRRPDGRLFFVAHDDAKGPYRVIGDSKHDPQAPWGGLVVPLPGKIYLTAEAAERTGREYLGRLIETEDSLKTLRGIRMRYRTYAKEIAEYKGGLADRDMPPDVIDWHQLTGASHWIWVVEVQDGEAAAASRDCVIGEIAIDATSDPLTPFALFGNLPTMMMRWEELNGPMSKAASSQGLKDRYETGVAIHV
jgi:hypothetical protein